ncbi:MAG: TetR/AcrR family transcriptional regulator [Bacillota bacterium]
MSYFIEATNRIIEEEGVEAVTIRRVADMAGYNSATLYNYFENIDHLIFFASMKYLKDYALDLPNYIQDSKDALDKYLKIWKCFCYYSFSSPKIYHTIFFNKFSDSLKHAIQEYYLIFPEELGEQSEDVLDMLQRKNIYERNRSILQTCAAEGFIQKKDLDELNEMVLLIYEGMLLRILKEQVDYSVDIAVEKTLKYMKQAIHSYRSTSS